MSSLAALILWLGIACYAVFGGADHGAGFWDLLAGGPKRGARPRALIDHAMGPVWEANNAWLIFALIVLWTAFPRAYAAIMSALFVPLALAAAGIALRGSAFVFRKPFQALAERRLLGATFALSSVLTPFSLGAAIGAIASGRVQTGHPGADPLSAWTNPTSLLVGGLAVLCAAFLAAVFLVSDARREGDEALESYFRRRAIASAIVTGLLVIAAPSVLRRDAPLLHERLVHEGLPFMYFSAACAVGCITLLGSRIARGPRILAAGAVVMLLAGWALAQYPYLLPTSLTIKEAAGAPATIAWVVVVSVIAVLVAGPALAFLFALAQRGLLEADTIREDQTDRFRVPRPRDVRDELTRDELAARRHWWGRAFSR